MQENADVVLNDINQIIKYKEKKNGGLELFDSTEKRIWNKDEKMLEVLADISNSISYPISDSSFVKKYRRATGSKEKVYALYKRYGGVKNTVFECSQYDMKTRIKMMFISNTKIVEHVLIELRQTGDVELDDKERIQKYKAHDGGLKLERNIVTDQNVSVMSLDVDEEDSDENQETVDEKTVKKRVNTRKVVASGEGSDVKESIPSSSQMPAESLNSRQERSVKEEPGCSSRNGTVKNAARQSTRQEKHNSSSITSVNKTSVPRGENKREIGEENYGEGSSKRVKIEELSEYNFSKTPRRNETPTTSINNQIEEISSKRVLEWMVALIRSCDSNILSNFLKELETAINTLDNKKIPISNIISFLDSGLLLIGSASKATSSSEETEESTNLKEFLKKLGFSIFFLHSTEFGKFQKKVDEMAAEKKDDNKNIPIRMILHSLQPILLFLRNSG